LRFDGPGGRDAPVETHRSQRWIIAGVENRAAAAEVRVLAHFPASLLDDRRRRAIVESKRGKVPDGRVDPESGSRELLALIKRDLR
jgi:hypothetical protein